VVAVGEQFIGAAIGELDDSLDRLGKRVVQAESCLTSTRSELQRLGREAAESGRVAEEHLQAARLGIPCSLGMRTGIPGSGSSSAATMSATRGQDHAGVDPIDQVVRRVVISMR